MWKWIKSKIVNWLLKGVIVEKLEAKKVVDKGNTLYVDIADFDHNTSDPGSPSESQMWYNSTDHVLRYRNDSETVDIGGSASLNVEETYSTSSLASNGTYTPSVNGYFSLAAGSYVQHQMLGSQWLSFRYNRTYWSIASCMGFINYYRIQNLLGSARTLCLYRWDMVIGDPTFSRHASGTLTAGSTYTPSVEGVWALTNDYSPPGGGTYTTIQHWNHTTSAWNTVQYKNSPYEYRMGLVVPATASDLRLYNDSGSFTCYYCLIRMY